MPSKSDELKERRDLAGSTSALTYHRLAEIDLALEGGGGGRFHNPPTITGSQPAVHYPRQPSGSPYASDPVPNEEPLGWSVSDVEPCGTPAEIQSSIDALRIAAPAISMTDASDGEGELKPDGLASAGAGNLGSLPFQALPSSPSPTPSTTQSGIKRRRGL
jgi:hypothetical protein